MTTDANELNRIADGMRIAEGLLKRTAGEVEEIAWEPDGRENTRHRSRTLRFTRSGNVTLLHLSVQTLGDGPDEVRLAKIAAAIRAALCKP